jgi:hypothetical protein
VEGHGDVRAVPVLLRRLGREYDPGLSLNIPPPFRAGRYKLVKEGELERIVELVARRLERPRAILILIDAEDDCPKELAPQLLARAEQARSDVSIGVVLGKREFEAWFLAAIEPLGGRRGLADTLSPVPDPESVRDAKGHLKRLMVGGRTYSETLDQPALAAVFDMGLARRQSASFDKCCREAKRLFEAVSGQSPDQSPQSG